ncbi:hypothetical protein Tfer_0539 [Thermincola ferriacetica]|uniref:Uncharacterized protein n=1 Tax=Thermincola ferriacetica TaxID=281456 RepID=A0A0L6W6Y1_9FIRM|nr:hypothetical protein [Thermincola ferriacetica]KNZ70859.1 hypothetical protein Tfer_0539 [Thermincola ferriacetica]
MNFSHLKLFVLVGGLVFVFIFIVALSSDVSLWASLSRGLLGGGIFAVITLCLTNIVRIMAFNNSNYGDGIQSNRPKLDLRIDDHGVLETNTMREKPENNVQESGNELNFEPLQAKQIDPQVSRIINNDPKRMAELIRKMGLEE